MRIYRLDVYVPETHADALCEALFAAGAGHIGNYDRCAFAFSGRGRFRPLAGADPFLGTAGQDESVREIKIEAVMAAEVKDAVIAALKRAHPYETPAFQYWAVEVG